MTPHDELMALAGKWEESIQRMGERATSARERGDAEAAAFCETSRLICAEAAADLRALLDSDAFRAMVRDAWLPIESAPKDGTRVLLSIKWSDVPVVGEFSSVRWWLDTEHYEVNCGTYCYGGSVCGDRGAEPTHWRPLPAPPQAIDAAASGAGEG